MSRYNELREEWTRENVCYSLVCYNDSEIRLRSFGMSQMGKENPRSILSQRERNVGSLFRIERDRNLSRSLSTWKDREQIMLSIGVVLA